MQDYFPALQARGYEVAIHYGLMVSDFDDAKFNRVLCRILNENHLEKESYQISKEVSKSTGDSWHTDQVALHDAINPPHQKSRD
ncbi:MAG: hypothetical protein Ct9H90mP16_18550 [Candidatus Poseidoniales archaeon]|nr:MAG: hypothetical protein Ct9H90mP16_18550 [Candidatus Poseidoniales archaeon]